MSYLLDKKIKRKKLFNGFLVGIFILILFFFRSSIFDGFSYVMNRIFYPVLSLGNNVGDKLESINSFFISKNYLYLQNKDLQNKLNANQALMSNYNSLLAENISLKDILGRKNEKKNMILATILTRPNQSFYDVFIIDIGKNKEIKVGDIVFALGNIPIGRVSAIYDDSAKVTLFSNPGGKMQVVLSSRNSFIEIIGRGGGNFEMIVPTDLTPQKGDEVVLPGINAYVVGIIETVISDPRDSFVKALLSSPVNMQEQKFVEIEIQR